MVKNHQGNPIDAEDDQEGGSGRSGESGIAFHLDLLAGQQRDDLLSHDELKRLLVVHREMHYELVKKQKNERKSRNELKEGKKPAVTNNYSVGEAGYGKDSSAKVHPIAQKAYFNGIDKQVIGLASENVAKTNADKKQEIQDRNELKNQLRNRPVPKFNPVLRP